MIFVIIHTPWPTSKSLDHPYLHVYTCLLQCFMLMLAYLVLGFVTLDALSECVVMWLHSTPIRPCLDVIAWNASPWCCLLRAHISHFPLHVMMCLPCLFMPPVGFLCIFTIFVYMVMHESCLPVCCPCFNTMKLWTFDPNLHLSLTNTTFCLFSCLFFFSFVCSLSCFFACHVYHA